MPYVPRILAAWARVAWENGNDVRAKIRSTIKRLLAKYGYPPDAEADAIRRVLDQMETFAYDWSPEA
jgi:type I restriction enzyme R subunit